MGDQTNELNEQIAATRATLRALNMLGGPMRLTLTRALEGAGRSSADDDAITAAKTAVLEHAAATAAATLDLQELRARDTNARRVATPAPVKVRI